MIDFRFLLPDDIVLLTYKLCEAFDDLEHVGIFAIDGSVLFLVHHVLVFKALDLRDQRVDLTEVTILLIPFVSFCELKLGLVGFYLIK